MKISFYSILIYTFSFLSFSGCVVKLNSDTNHVRLPSVLNDTKPLVFKNAQEYETYRKQLIAKDSATAFDPDIRLSGQEQMANRKIVALRQKMIAHYDSVHFFPPARYFHKSKNHIYTTTLYKVLKQMPKGAIHHLHPTAGGSFKWIVERALKEPNCFVYWAEDTGQYIKGQLQFFKPGTAPAGFVQVQKINKSEKNFPDQLYDLLTFDSAIGEDSVDIWGEFGKSFKRVGSFTRYQPVFVDFYTALFDILAADGVQHLELREAPPANLYDLEHENGYFTPDSAVRYYEMAAQRVRTTREPNLTYKLIYTNSRINALEVIRKDFIKAFEMRKKYPHLIKGYDLVSHEDPNHTTLYYRDVWLMRDSLAKVYGVDMPLCFHNGESDWEHVTNIYDAVLLNSRRIGHGTNLAFFPVAEELIKKQNICIEVNPLSAQNLGYIVDLRMHPAHTWIKRGVQISISPDDPAIFDYVGVTPDYWSILLAWELDLRDLKKLSMNALTYSFLNEEEKKKAFGAWQQKWDAFIKIVNSTL